MAVLLVVIFFVIVIGVAVSNFRRDTPDSDEQFSSSVQSDGARITPASPETVDLSTLLPQQFIVLDLETTGLNLVMDEIIEVGAIRVTLGSDNHEVFQQLVKPRKKLPRRIMEITGISQEMVDSKGLPLGDVLPQFIEFIQDLPLVTFNAEFDMGFLWNAAKRHGLVINNRYACALKRARHAWPGLQSYRLVDLAKMGNLPSDDTHRAIGDCKRATIIFISATSTLGQKVSWTAPPI